MRCLLVALTLAPFGVMASQGPLQTVRTTADDWQILSAILEHTVRREVERFRSIAGLGPASVLLVLEDSMSLCSSPRDRSAPPCVRAEAIESFRTPLLTRNVQRFLPGGSRYDSTLRTRLVEAFLSRNAQRSLLNPIGGTVLLVPHSRLRETLTEKSSETVGYSAFALPAYSDGYAIAYGFYTCGGLCNRETLFVLNRASGRWEVELEHGVAMS